MFCAATDITISVQCAVYPLGSRHDSTTDGDGKERTDNCNYVTDWMKRTDKRSRVRHLLQYVPLFTARQPPVGQGLLIVEALRSLRHTTLDKTPLDW